MGKKKEIKKKKNDIIPPSLYFQSYNNEKLKKKNEVFQLYIFFYITGLVFGLVNGWKNISFFNR